MSGSPGARPPGTALVGKYLLGAEQVVIAERKHWAILSAPVSICFFGLLAAFIIDVSTGPSGTFLRDVAWVAWTASAGFLAWRIVEWWADRFVVTNKRVMLVRGLITRKVGMMPLAKVTDMSYERSILARLLGYGVFVMESAGQDQAFRRIHFVPRPDWLYHQMCALLFTPDAPRPTTPAAGDDGTGSGPGGLGRWTGFGPNDPDPDAPPRP